MNGEESMTGRDGCSLGAEGWMYLDAAALVFYVLPICLFLFGNYFSLLFIY